MKKTQLITLLIGVLLLSGINNSTSAQKKDPKPAFEAEWESLSKNNKEPEWFADAKLGIYYHWGLYTVPAFKTEWYPRFMYVPDRRGWGSGCFQHHEKTYGHPSEFNYHDFVPMFKAEKFDPVEWADLFKKAGARFAGPVAIHHDGFAMWDSEVNPWNAGDKGPKRDVAGELYAELDKRGIKKIATFHHARTLQRNADDPDNWDGGSSHFPYHPDYATSSTDPELKYLYGNISAEEFNDYWLGQVTEVIDKYSPEIIWFDSWLDRMPQDYLKKMVAYQFNSGAAKGQENLVCYKQHDLPRNVGVLDIEQGGMKDMSPDYWMTDITISYSSWSYVQGQTYKDAPLVLKNMIDVWSKKGIVLLNVSPTKEGIITDEQKKVLGDLGSWLDTYGEAVYGTRSHSIFGYGDAEIRDGNHGGQSATIKYSASDIRFTTSKDGKTIFVFSLGMPEAGSTLNIKYIVSDSAPDVKKVSMVGNGQKVKWETKSDILAITAPEEKYMNDIATIFKVELK